MSYKVKFGFTVQLSLFLASLLLSSITFATPITEGIQSYLGTGSLSPEHKQRLADDITRYRTADNLWDVLRDEFSLPHYENNPIIQEKIDWYMNNQDYLLRATTRAAPYLYYISQQVKKRHLPAELVLLPIIESAYNPFSTSPVGAAGVWQLMPNTAIGLGVHQEWGYDGRRDVIASTRGALNYFAYLQSFFEGNWLLAIAAYNTGEGNVLAAIRRNIRDGRDTDFWSLPLARETRDYVPMLLALAIIISHPEKYPIYFPPIRNAPYLGQVDIGSQITLKYAATLAGIPYQKIIALNPGCSRLATSKSTQYKLVLPIENIEQFTDNLTRSPLSPPVDWTHYRVKTGDTLASVSRKFNMEPTSLRRMNHLAINKSTLRPGSTLLIPNNSSNTTSDKDDVIDDVDVTTVASNPAPDVPTRVAEPIEHKVIESHPVIVADSRSRYTLQPGDTIYMVRKSDTITSIAKRFRVTTNTLTSANNLTFGKVTPGKQIIVPTHIIATAPIRTRIATAKSHHKINNGDTVYLVRRGDTIEKIARRFHSSPASIRLTNLVDNSSISEGDRLIIPAHIRG